MAIVQDTYNDDFAKGFPGMVANGETSNRISRTCEQAAGIAFGAAVFRGAASTGCVGAAGGAAGKDLGFAIADHGIQPLPGGVAADIYPQYESVPIITQGAILVTVTGAVAEGAAVTVGIGAGLAAGIGSTAADATHIAFAGWVFDEDAADGELCRIVRR